MAQSQQDKEQELTRPVTMVMYQGLLDKLDIIEQLVQSHLASHGDDECGCELTMNEHLSVVHHSLPVLQSKPARTGWHSEYEVQPGDTFAKIAKEKLGQSGRHTEIQALNPNVVPNSPVVGSLIRLPKP